MTTSSSADREIAAPPTCGWALYECWEPHGPNDDIPVCGAPAVIKVVVSHDDKLQAAIYLCGEHRGRISGRREEAL